MGEFIIDMAFSVMDNIIVIHAARRVHQFVNTSGVWELEHDTQWRGRARYDTRRIDVWFIYLLVINDFGTFQFIPAPALTSVLAPQWPLVANGSIQSVATHTHTHTTCWLWRHTSTCKLTLSSHFKILLGRLLFDLSGRVPRAPRHPAAVIIVYQHSNWNLPYVQFSKVDINVDRM